MHRNLGVHISFVRSTQLDQWTWDQLRAMKVGGNQSAQEYFRQHGINQMDAKSKYSSRAAQMYKERLGQKVQEDIQRNPKFTADDLHSGHSAAAASTPQNKDFFDDGNWGWGQPATTVNSQPQTTSPNEVGSFEQRRPSASEMKKMLSTENINQPAANDTLVSPVGGFEQANSLSSSAPVASTTTTTSSQPKRKGKLGVKKVEISFDDIEQKAKEEAKRREELEKQGLLEMNATNNTANNSSSDKANGFSSRLAYQEPLSPTSTTAASTADRLGLGASSSFGAQGAGGFGSLGFGATGPAVAAASGKSTSSANSSSQQPEETGARQKFAGAKAISSDMYFQRDAHAPADAESTLKLQKFQGQSSISSAQFYDRNEDNLARSRNGNAQVQGIFSN